MKSEFKLTATDTIINLLKDNLGQKYHAYFFGDPIAIPQSMLPAIAVVEDNTEYALGATQFDDITHTMTIQVMYNKKDDFGKPAGEVGVARQIQEDVQGRDAVTGEFLQTSIIGILRKNLTEGDLYIESIPKVNFGTVPRPQDVITAEAHIQITLVESQQVSSRT